MDTDGYAKLLALAIRNNMTNNSQNYQLPPGMTIQQLNTQGQMPLPNNPQLNGLVNRLPNGMTIQNLQGNGIQGTPKDNPLLNW